MSTPDDDWETDVVVPVAPPAPAQLPEFPVLLRNPSAGQQQPRQQHVKKAEQQQQQQQHQQQQPQQMQGYVPFEKDAPALHPMLREIAASDHNSLLFRVEDKVQRFLQDSQLKHIAINGVSGHNVTMVRCLGEHFGLKVACSPNGSITLTKQPSTRRYPPGLGMLPAGVGGASPQVKVMMRKDDQSAGASRFQARGNDARVQQFAAQRQENKVSAAEREQAYNEARQRILYGTTAEQMQQRQQQDAQLSASDRSVGVAPEADCFSAQEVAMAAAAAVFGGDDDRDGFDADRRAQTVASSKTVLQRKSPPTSSSDLASKSLEPTHENPPVQAPTSSVPATATASTDKSAPPVSASTTYRPARVPVPAAASGSTSERFASRMRDGSDPDYDRHYGKYAPRNAVVPGTMSWPVMPTGGGYGMPVAGIPMGAPYEAMSPMYDLWNVGAAVGSSNASGSGGNFGMGSVSHALPAYAPGYVVGPTAALNPVHAQQGAYGYGWGVVGSAAGPMGQQFYPNQQHVVGSNGSHE